ncbi:hypothetical protein SAMN05444161_3097 [Rhizobiales bacterium GAS191]|jgi:hypothetical protein|nr:hypothetical protein SAMN05519103_02294 [Rhizobiales bacterium GAS113]SED38811.1 hypothetical protein SAMN05444161_3097 [Rhizobiales bacterium GAS191]
MRYAVRDFEPEELLMAVAAILTSLFLGTGFACAAVHMPARAAALEWYGGVLLIGGLGLLGSALPRFCGI